MSEKEVWKLFFCSLGKKNYLFEFSTLGRKRTTYIKTGRAVISNGSRQGNGYYYSGCARSYTESLLHRAIANCFLPKTCLLKTDVNHIDGDKSNNSVSNLEWVTPQENQRHGRQLGIIPRVTSKPGPQRPKNVIVHYYNSTTGESIMGKMKYIKQKEVRPVGISALHDLREGRRENVKGWSFIGEY